MPSIQFWGHPQNKFSTKFHFEEIEALLDP